MIKLEIQKNITSFLIWTIIIVSLFLMVFGIYPSMMKDTEAITELVNSMDTQFLEVFNMDIMGFESVFGWIATEGHVLLLLIGGMYFGILGATILLKEENDGTIEFIYSKNISRNRILSSKILVGIILAILLNLIVLVFLIIGLAISDDLELNKLVLFLVSSTIAHISIYLISMCISTFMRRTNKSTMVALALVFLLYTISIISGMSDDTEFLKYISPFYYMSARPIIETDSIPLENILIILGIDVIVYIISQVRYNKKELV